MNGFSQTTSPKQIEADLKACLDSTQNFTTAGMSNCIIRATVQWDQLLNETYQELLSLLTDDQKIKLKESQRKWLAFRDQELAFSNELYASLGGTMWIPVMYETNMKLTKQRSLELQSYLDSLKCNGE